MTFNFNGAPVLVMLLLTLLWWGVVAYLALRFIRATERATRAHEEIAREMARLVSEMREERSKGG